MKKSNPLFASTAYTAFLTYQKKYFLEKADLSPTVYERILKTKINNSLIQKLFSEKVTIERLSPSTLHHVYKVVAHKKIYIVRINLFEKRPEFQFYLDTKLPFSTDNAQINYHVDLSRNILAYDYEIVEIKNGTTFYNIGPAKLQPYQLKKAGEKLFLMHQTEGRNYGQINIKNLVTKNSLIGYEKKWSDHLEKNLAEHILYSLKNSLLTTTQSKKIINIFSAYRNFLNSIQMSKLLHGDVSNHNIFLYKRETFFIDFDDAIIGDPYYDLAYYATGMVENEKSVSHFLNGYTSLKKLDDNFQKRFDLYFLRIALAKEIIIHKTKKKRRFKNRLDLALSRFSD